MTNDVTTLQKALLTIKKLKQMVQDNNNHAPVAIVGLSCRFPQADNKQEFWDLLENGRNAVGTIPPKRWELLKGTEEALQREPSHSYHGSYLTDITGFDAYFFGITPREAQRMDPQQRILLETAYEAFEDAGQTVESLAGSNTGVFTSLYANPFGHMQQIDSDMDALYIPTGNAISIAANRLSYLFDLRGPSLVLDTACSSSLIGIHLACLNIQNKLCDAALVAGVNINLMPSINAILNRAKMLSPDGRCHTFDAGANGYVQGEGAGAIFLKPLANALRDQDRIYAVIMGSASNQDGKTNGLTAPNGLQQETLLKAAYANAKINPLDIGYVECHGTGTFLGDPIEVQALGNVVGNQRPVNSPCWIGSVKTNIGHLEPAAGIASVIKVALGLAQGNIPPHLNFKQANPHIAFQKYNFSIPQTTHTWPKYGDYRLGGISGFGFGGSNAHLVLRDLSPHEIPKSENQIFTPEIFTLSAKDPQGLQAYITRWVAFLGANPDLCLSQLCYNTHVRRSHFPFKIAVIANSITELVTQLKNQQFLRQDENDKTIPRLPADWQTLDAATLAGLYVRNAKIDWQQYESNRRYQHLDMPQYPWQHKDYWPPLKLHNSSNIVNTDHLFQGDRIFSPLKYQQFEFKFNHQQIPEIKDTYNILHAGYYFEMITFAINKLHAQKNFIVENIQFTQPVIVNEQAQVTIQLILEKITDTILQFTFYSNSNGQEWKEHVNGRIVTDTPASKHIGSIANIKQRAITHDNGTAFYDRVKAMAMPAGGSISWTNHYWCNDTEILCEFQPPAGIKKTDLLQSNLHFSIIDACIQGLFLVLPKQYNMPYVASAMRKIKFYGQAADKLYLYAKLGEISQDGQQYLGDWYLIDEKSEVIVECEGLTMTRLGNKTQIETLADTGQIKIDLTTVPLSRRPQFLNDFFRQHIATLFSMPVTDVQSSQSLNDMGMDSLLALVLIRTVESLGVTYSLEQILQGPTIHDLVDYVLAAHKPVAVQPQKWIACRKKQPSPEIRLFCFPYGGGGASIYRDWQNHLPASIEVCPIQLPGREERMKETPANNLTTVIDELVENLKNEFTMPFAFFGHSFGALLAFELTRRLRHKNMQLPTHLFASAFPDPRKPTQSLNIMLQQLANKNINLFELTAAELAKIDNEKLTTIFDVFSKNGITEYNNLEMNRMLIQVLLPIFIGDMNIVRSYHYHEEAPMPLPINVFVGRQDQWVLPEDHQGWAAHTSKGCKFYEFDNGHLFIKDPAIQRKVLGIIQNTIFADVEQAMV